MPDIQKTGITQYSSEQIIHYIFGRRCILFTNMLAVYYLSAFLAFIFLKVVLMCGGIFNNYFAAYCLLSIV